MIGGSGNLTKVPGGTTGSLVLGGANTYTGTTTVSAGTLSISADDNLVPSRARPPRLTDLERRHAGDHGQLHAQRQPRHQPGVFGGTIDVAGGTTLTYNGIAAGTGSLTRPIPARWSSASRQYLQRHDDHQRRRIQVGLPTPFPASPT